MRNLWLLFLVGLSMGFFSTKSCVFCQSFSTTDDLYIEGQPSGDLPVDDEDGEDDGSGSGSGDYGFVNFSENEKVVTRILNIPQTTVSKEMLPFQPTTDSPNTSPTTEGTSQDEELQTTNVFPEPSEELMTQDTYSPIDPTSPAPRHTPTSETSADDLMPFENYDSNMDYEILPATSENDLSAENGQFKNMEVTSENMWERTEVLAAVIACGVVGFLCAVFLLLLLAYRMKKKDEGSYDLGDTKLSATGYHKAPTKEFYA
ncbi:Syndecan-2-B [Oryzias melastigma]|uniref:Syndecan n=1 Tax=Oryzias melastigma TaxID=30732 RepID=A0A3B3BYT3_ORYME|nr:syndecan-2 [Oryzias melastigma]KAF6725451.1 Syndecan-2-B [Oryzias melastigma]